MRKRTVPLKILSFILVLVLVVRVSQPAFADGQTANEAGETVTITAERQGMKFNVEYQMKPIVIETNKKAMFIGNPDETKVQVNKWVNKAVAEEIKSKLPDTTTINISTRAGILDPRNMGNVSYAQAAERGQATLTTIGMVFSNSKLFVKGFRDVWGATAQKSDGENLNDPSKRMDYWKKQGVYEKYNARERAFINKVVFPAVAVARGAGVLAGGGAVAYGAAALLGLATAPALAVGGAVALAGAAFVAYNVHKLNKGENIASSTVRKVGTYGTAEAAAIAGDAKWAGRFTGRIGSFRKAGVAARILLDRLILGQSTGRILSGVATTGKFFGKALGGNLAIEGGLYAVAANATGLTELARVWGIPEETTNVNVEATEKRMPEKRVAGEIKVRITK